VADWFIGAALGQGVHIPIVPFEIDYRDEWPSDVPEGRDWKETLAAFTGDASAAAFYAAFESWVAGATEDAMVALLPDAGPHAVTGLFNGSYVSPTNTASWPFEVSRSRAMWLLFMRLAPPRSLCPPLSLQRCRRVCAASCAGQASER
jgi:hypothetical protein